MKPVDIVAAGAVSGLGAGTAAVDIGDVGETADCIDQDPVLARSGPTKAFAVPDTDASSPFMAIVHALFSSACSAEPGDRARSAPARLA